MRRPLAILAAAAVGAVLLSCSEAIPFGPGSVVSVRIEPDSLELAIGADSMLRAIPLDSSQQYLPQNSATWSSSDASVATVDTTGRVYGIAAGTAQITADVQGIKGQMKVHVAKPATIVAGSAPAFTDTVGGSDPAPLAVAITNGGGLPLVGLQVDSIHFAVDSQKWLTTSLDSTTAPSTLTLTATIAGLKVATQYTATVYVSSPVASNSPLLLGVTLQLAAGAPATMTKSAGDGQSATVGTAVTTAPSVTVKDQFGNLVSGAQVTFAVTGGGGSVTVATATSGTDGIAKVGSWTLGSQVGANTLQATLAGVPPVTFTATGTVAAASAIAVNTGDNQSAVAGSAVPTPPSVKVTDTFGNPVPGVAVTFAVASGGGTVTGANATTNAAGVAAVGSWTLGSGTGANTLTATSAGLSGSPVTFSATALSGTATTLAIATGDTQSDTVAATLATPLTVRVTDQYGNGVSGVPVAWAVASGGGTVNGAASVNVATDVNGYSSVTRVLGTTAGSQTVTAGVGGLTPPSVTFAATASAGAPVSIALSAGGAQTATVNTAVATPPAVTVHDQFANPVPGISVNFTVTAGGGAVSPTSAITTDASGVAAATSWTLGTAAGSNNNTLTATAAPAGVTGNPVTFTASATADVAANIAITAGNNQTDSVGASVAIKPQVHVTDQYGNNVSGANVTFSVTGGGGSLTGASPTTNASGVATLGSWTLGNGSTMSSTGTYVNTLQATTGASVSTTFSATAHYSFATHVQPVFTVHCANCHTNGGAFAGLKLDVDSAYIYLVNVASTCNPSFKRVATGGGTTAEANSVLMARMDSLSTISGCGPNSMPPAGKLSGALRDIIRAWIRNGAPNN